MIRPALAEAVLDLAMALARLANWIDPLTPPTPKPRHASASAHAPVVGLGFDQENAVVLADNDMVDIAIRAFDIVQNVVIGG